MDVFITVAYGEIHYVGTSFDEADKIAREQADGMCVPYVERWTLNSQQHETKSFYHDEFTETGEPVNKM